jgi:succinate dehydrogenase/fumarate reductase flavoprotein subunit
MEMVQFHPTGMVWPRKALGTLATEAIRGEGGILLNSKGERFMKNYYPQRMELGPRDIVARANFNEIVSGGGTKHGGVWLDITHLPKKKILERLPSMYSQFKKIAGIDISKQRMEVAPTSHYSMGGVNVDDKCKTKVKGLFAVGELSGQVHGANRLGGNSLLGTIVFGKIAGRQAANEAISVREKRAKREFIPSRVSLLSNKKELEGAVIHKEFFAAKNAIKFRNEIQKLMRDNAGIVREDMTLRRGLKRLLALKKEFYFKDNIMKNFKIDDNFIRTLEVKSALIVSEAILRSALIREESRGAHFRSDFPNKNDEKWKVNIFSSRGKERRREKMVLSKRRVKEIRGPLRDLIKQAHDTQLEHHLLE